MNSWEVEAGHEIVMNFDQYPIGIKFNRIGTVVATRVGDSAQRGGNWKERFG